MLKLEIITPEKVVFEGQAKSVKLPGADGYFGVLPKHAPMISALGAGKVSFTDEKGGEQNYVIEGGVVEVLNNRVVALAEKIN